MSRNRLPKAKAEVSGAAIKNPQRHMERKTPAGMRPIGAPRAQMPDTQKQIWKEFCDELPWLNNSHRALLQIACLLRARIEADLMVSVPTISTYSAVLSKLGATPVDESKINCGDGDDEDEADKFFASARH